MDKVLQKRLNESLKYIRSRSTAKPKFGIILGSGLGGFAEQLEIESSIDTSEIPNYPISTVEGHKGRLIFGKLANVELIASQGRVHYYETGDLGTILYPILIANLIGIKTILLTNAAGGVNRYFHPGDLMLIKDHINLTFENPLKHITIDSKNKCSSVYDLKLIRQILKISQTENIPLKEGIYVCVKGPSYETASEIEMIRRIGGDAVGMSTVNEATLAHKLGMKVAGISCITNYATGVTEAKLSHKEVTEVANMVKDKFTKLISTIFKSLK